MPKSKAKIKGGKVFWYKQNKKNGKLNSFDYTKNYDIGTLFLRKYRNVNDQGHVAVLYSKYKKDNTKVLYGKIIHSYDTEDGGEIGQTGLGRSHFWTDDLEGYYEFAIEPKDWLM